MNRERSLDASVLIATCNRAHLLDETLAWLARVRSASPTWEAIVIDNNSTDATKAIVERHQDSFPVPLRYLFEPRQGRSSALNTGAAAARGRVLAFTDDDVQVSEGWLEAACSALLEGDERPAYAGGPVRPIWGAPPPRWLDLSRGDLWGTIAIQDHGSVAMRYEAAQRVPLGANMAVDADVFDRIGGFRAELGRADGRVILGQEVPEWLHRARAAGYWGMYVPAMEVHHHVPAARLTRRYFGRWWFGKGVSRAALDRIHPVTECNLDLRRTPQIFGVPRFLYGTLLRSAIGWMRNVAARRPEVAFRHRMMIVFFAGYFSARLRELIFTGARGSGGNDYRTSNVTTTGR